MTKPEHIKIRTENGLVVLVADDYEIFDFLDDYLDERGVDFDCITEEERDGRTFVTIYFPEGTRIERVRSVVEEIPASKLQRIWDVNNTK